MQKNTLLACLIFILFLSQESSYAQEWQMKQAKIMTPWSENIDPNNVLPEYPRPQMVRQNWMNLNGIWDFTLAPSYHPDRPYANKILVPFCMESAISGLMWRDLDNQYIGKKYHYRRYFTLPESMQGKKVLLHFGGVGWLTEVWMNGQRVGTHMGEYDPFYFDVTTFLKASGNQELTVIVQDYQNHGGAPSGKQKTNEKSIWYTPSTGIWQTVWLEAVSNVYIRDLALVPDIDKKEIQITTLTTSNASAYKVELDIYDGEQLISSTSNVSPGSVRAVQVPDMKLWSPDDPFLYDLKVRLYENGNLIDSVASYFGMRKISMGTFAGKPCFLLNNEYIFQHGFLDQGYWPDGIYTAPSDEALKYDLEMTKKFGMNMTRKHIKVEPARWYYHCDKLGLLVWQDMPNAEGTAKYDGMGTKPDNFHRELKLMMDNLKNHPSIVMWIVYNEGWGQPAADIVRQGVDVVRSADTTRLVSVASGWNDQEYGDIKDTHWYPDPNIYPNPQNKRISVCGEYGGITLRIAGHQWLGGSNMTYTEVASSDALRDRFNQYTDRITGLGSEGICAAIYTQLTDVEDEENGLITYDRKVVKLNDTQIKAIADKLKHNYTHGTVDVLATSQDKTKKAEWKYTMTNDPISGTAWKEPSFDDSSWNVGEAPFGNDITLKYGHNDQPKISNWTTKYIYMRRTVEFSDLLTADNLKNLRAKVFHDEDCSVFINGIQVAQWTGYVNSYQYKAMNVDLLRSAIKIGQPNVLAVLCKQTTFGQFIDIGFCLYDIERKSLAAKATSINAPVITKQDAHLQIIPNPAKSEFAVAVDGDEPVSSVSLFDTSGKLVRSYSVQSKYDIKNVRKGIYVVMAKTASRQFTGRLQVQ